MSVSGLFISLCVILQPNCESVASFSLEWSKASGRLQRLFCEEVQLLPFSVAGSTGCSPSFLHFVACEVNWFRAIVLHSGLRTLKGSRSRALRGMAEGNWWEAPGAAPLAFELTAERLELLPWTWQSVGQSRPPTRSRSRTRGRLCELCGHAYLGNRECEGAERCPRFFGGRRHELEWHQGFWVPSRLAAAWRSADAAARARDTVPTAGASSGAEAPGPPPKRPPPMAAACGVALLRSSLPPKPPPTGGASPPPATALPSWDPKPPPAMPGRIWPPPTGGASPASDPKPPPPMLGRTGPPPTGGAGPPPSTALPKRDPKPPPALDPRLVVRQVSAVDPRLMVKQPPTPAQLAAYEVSRVLRVSSGWDASDVLSCAGSASSRGPARGAPFPEPHAAFVGQDDTVVAPVESGSELAAAAAGESGIPGVSVEAEARSLISGLGAEVARHLAAGGDGYPLPPYAKRPATGAGRGVGGQS